MEVDKTTSLAIGRATMESISERLSELEDLYFPKAVESSTVNPSQRKSLLLDLLSRDVPVFLGIVVFDKLILAKLITVSIN